MGRSNATYFLRNRKYLQISQWLCLRVSLKNVFLWHYWTKLPCFKLNWQISVFVVKYISSIAPWHLYLLSYFVPFMEQVQFYISMTSVLDCLDHSNNTYKFLKWVAFPFDVKWSAVCLPGLSEQDHWHYSCYTIYLKESLSFNVNPWAFVHDTPAVKKTECKV